MKSVNRVFGTPLPDIIFPLRSDGEIDVCPVDSFAGQTFNVNEFGHIKSDVSVLMEAQSKSEIDLISQRLVEVQGEDPDLSGLTDSDIFRYSMSRYYQTPAEVQQYGESLAKAQFARQERLDQEAAQKAANEKFVAAQKAAFENFQKARANGSIDQNGNVVSKTQ